MTQAVDVCLVNDELELAEFRITFLKDVISHHYFFEAPISHGGEAKPLHFAASHLAKDQRVTIVAIPVPEAIAASESRWAIEEFSRDWAMWFVSQKHPGAPILLADIDEIPSREQIQSGVQLAKTHEVVDLPLNVYYRNANWKAREVWRDTKIFLGSRATPGIRFIWGKKALGERGAHFRYLGYNSATIREKYRNFAHAEYEIDHHSLEAVLDFADAYRLSHVPRFDVGDFGLLSAVPKSRANSAQVAVLDFFPDSWSESPMEWSVTRRAVASFWMNRWLRDASCRSVPLSDFVQYRSKVSRPEWYGALAMIFLHVMGVPRLMRILRRMWVSRKQKIPGRRLVHRIRGVYRHGNLYGAINTSLSADRPSVS
jgi:hypothetical protein